jgi:hypothetical protein
LRYFCDFHNTAQSEQLPNGQKFAQSGHTASKQLVGGRVGGFYWKIRGSLKLLSAKKLDSTYFQERK